MNRRQAMAWMAGAGLAPFLPLRLNAQDKTPKKDAPGSAFDTAKVEVTPLRGGVHLLAGPGGNIAFMPGDLGVLVVDSGVPGRTDDIKKAIAVVSPKAIRVLVNTHWHYDHTGGNAALAGDGVLIAAHENCRKWMAEAEHDFGMMNMKLPAPPPAALAAVSFADTLDMFNGGDHVHLEHFSPAHTDTDISVHFAKANVLHMGDTFFNTGGYPFIDVSSGGNLPGVIAAAEKGLKLADKETKIIPGHGPVCGVAALKFYRDMLADIRAVFQKLLDAGRTLPEAVSAKPLAKFDAQFGQGFISGDVAVGMFYRSMTGGRDKPGGK